VRPAAPERGRGRRGKVPINELRHYPTVPGAGPWLPVVGFALGATPGSW
jgi:hypothetical protein